MPPEGHSPSRAVISAAYTQGWPERSASSAFLVTVTTGKGLYCFMYLSPKLSALSQL